MGRHPGHCLLVTAPSAHHTTPCDTTLCWCWWRCLRAVPPPFGLCAVSLRAGHAVQSTAARTCGVEASAALNTAAITGGLEARAVHSSASRTCGPEACAARCGVVWWFCCVVSCCIVLRYVVLCCVVLCCVVLCCVVLCCVVLCCVVLCCVVLCCVLLSFMTFLGRNSNVYQIIHFCMDRIHLNCFSDFSVSVGSKGVPLFRLCYGCSASFTSPFTLPHHLREGQLRVYAVVLCPRILGFLTSFSFEPGAWRCSPG